jgi:hypothetical protein
MNLVDLELPNSVGIPFVSNLDSLLRYKIKVVTFIIDYLCFGLAV